MSRKSNGQGHTYKIGGSYRTVIRHNGSAITAMAKTHQESRKRAKEKLESHILNELNPSKTDYSQMPLEEYLSTWLETEHRHYIAHSTYKRYDSLARNHINPLIGKTPICDITPRVITDLLNRMREGSNIRNRTDRAIFGFSMGGYGAAIIGLHHPELYGQVVTLAGYFVVDDLTGAFGLGAETDKKHAYQTPSAYLKVAKKMRWYVGESKFDYTALIRGQAAAWGAKLKSVKATFTVNTKLSGGHSYTYVQAEIPNVLRWFTWSKA